MKPAKQSSRRERGLQAVESEPVNNHVPPAEPKRRKPRQARTIEGDLHELRVTYAKRVKTLEDELGKLDSRQRVILDELAPARSALERVLFVMGGGDGQPTPEVPPEPSPVPAEEPPEVEPAQTPAEEPPAPPEPVEEPAPAG